ncbi:MAG: hypothetical protein M3Z08_05800 [Chloroflexota bacterium]|nr:hypothetical protein [Chloroflexota bacterium]
MLVVIIYDTIQNQRREGAQEDRIRPLLPDAGLQIVRRLRADGAHGFGRIEPALDPVRQDGIGILVTHNGSGEPSSARSSGARDAALAPAGTA